ncbi:cell wall-active antibiotics response protein [Neobacillus notoginsengisoli]|uniref:Cell wall-active antibiotics response protein n=1 Tax=Neobacillus notoginsengisoli TaxID=1578198 RepID=A0A417YW71_9BACI|nr:cell wall-active antibiotics response protein LiaF [Neobacillus notoginsengisoli]RHW41538.1 cell wall-active antibiotics response protein [Neobacillus notoginsengisoli]
MDRKMTGDYMGWLIFGGGIILLLELAFFNSGLIFSLFLSGAMIYIGRKKSPSKFGRFLFWIGIIILAASLLNMMTLKLILIGMLVLFFIQFIQAKQAPKRIAPTIQVSEQDGPGTEMVRTKPLFENVLFGQQKTPEQVYEWNDINIHAGLGDTVIDLSYTLFPKGETVIFIRNFIGNIQILVPYEMEVSIHHSVVAGSTSVFGNEESKVLNQVFQLKTANYDQSVQKVKIFTSVIVGNLEVNRI